MYIVYYISTYVDIIFIYIYIYIYIFSYLYTLPLKYTNLCIVVINNCVFIM